MSALVDSAGLGRALSADIDFETGRVAVRNSDGGSPTLDTKETLAGFPGGWRGQGEGEEEVVVQGEGGGGDGKRRLSISLSLTR